jgi:hypothetical protein
VLAGSSPPARADGDPASDVLATQPLFLPQDAGVPATQQAQLTAELSAATRSGYPIRVAIIASAADLGSVTALWREPENYARFLGLELPLVYTGPLLVVMPNGLGTYRLGRAGATAQSALANVRAGGLGATALDAIHRLASASGHTLPATSITPPSKRATSDTASWIAFAIGCGLIVLAWIASLRARAPRLRRRKYRGVSDHLTPRR